jgi:hypothetical protein
MAMELKPMWEDPVRIDVENTCQKSTEMTNFRAWEDI